MRSWARWLLAVSPLFVALACAADGGHCLNPQPDLPCGASYVAAAGGAPGSTTSPGNPVLVTGGSAAALGGTNGVGEGASSGSPSSGGGLAAGGAPSGAGAAGEAGASGDSAGSPSAGVHE